MQFKFKLQYLDCVNGRCKCADKDKYNLRFQHSSEDDPAKDKNKMYLKHKRRCRVEVDSEMQIQGLL